MNKGYDNDFFSIFLLRTKVNGWIYTNSIAIIGLAKEKKKYYNMILP